MKHVSPSSAATAIQIHRARQALMMAALSFATFCLFSQVVRAFL